MRKNNFIKFLKNINLSINNLLEKNLNKLKFDNFSSLARSNRIVITIVALFFLFLTYLLVPNFYKGQELAKKLNNELSSKLSLNFKFSQDLKYKLFPRPHFLSSDTIIYKNNFEISKIKKLKIYVSLDNLFSIDNLEINNILINNANFNLNFENYNFFLNLLDNNYLNNNLRIKNSNIFFRNFEKEVLFINKIKDMKYYYDQKDLNNTFYSENELFNIPYKIKVLNDKKRSKLFSKINLEFLKVQIENEFNYSKEIKIGNANLIFNKSKAMLTYKKNKKFYEINLFDKLNDPSFFYMASFNLNPFYSNFEGKTDKIDLSHFYNPNSLIVQILKSEILNNKNIDFKLKVNADNISKTDFKKINLISKIQEGLIDIDNTHFNWKNHAEFKLKETLIFIKNGELVLDGKLQIKISNNDEIYQYLLTPKNFRKKFKYVDLTFSYNIDQKSTLLNDIRIDNEYNQKLNRIMGNIILKDSNLQNKIYLKNLLNEAIKSYAG